jgi:signal peptidase II
MGKSEPAQRRQHSCRRQLTVLLLLLAVAALDQFTKFAVSLFLYGPVTLVPGFLYLQLVRNGGAAWGILFGQRILLCAIAVAALSAGAIFHRRLGLERPINCIATGLIGGGTLGNLIDRLRLGQVVDFIDVHLPFYRWPTFNIADGALCLGVALYFFASLIRGRK